MKTVKSSQGTTGKFGDLQDEINPQTQPDYPGQTQNVDNAVRSLADLTWEERKAFMKRYSDIFSQEADLRGQGKEFDVEAYR